MFLNPVCMCVNSGMLFIIIVVYQQHRVCLQFLPSHRVITASTVHCCY